MGRVVWTLFDRVRSGRRAGVPPRISPRHARSACEPVRPSAPAHHRRSSPHIRPKKGLAAVLHSARPRGTRALLHLLGVPLIHCQLRRLHLWRCRLAAVLHRDSDGCGRPRGCRLPRHPGCALPRSAGMGGGSQMDRYPAPSQLRPDAKAGVRDHPTAHRRPDAAVDTLRGCLHCVRRRRPNVFRAHRLRSRKPILRAWTLRAGRPIDPRRPLVGARLHNSGVRRVYSLVQAYALDRLAAQLPLSFPRTDGRSANPS